MNEIAKVLTAAEVDYLAECEERIERGLQTFVEVGTALAMIRDNKLYRATHGTFADYCEARWSIGRAHAYRMIDAAQAVSPIGDTDLPMPSNEAQARELARVPAADRVAVWRAATEATAGRPTAAAVRAAANPDQPAAKPVEADAQLDTPGGAGASEAETSEVVEVGDGAGVLTGAPAPQTAVDGPGASPSTDASGEGEVPPSPARADAAGDPTDRPSAGSPVSLDDPEQVEIDRRERVSARVAAGLVHLHEALDPDPIAWLCEWMPDAYKGRGAQLVEDTLTPTGLRTIAKHLDTLADYLDKTEGAL